MCVRVRARVPEKGRRKTQAHSVGVCLQDDIKTRRKFLRRGEYPGITFSDLYLGATVNVYSRELVVVDYGASLRLHSHA